MHHEFRFVTWCTTQKQKNFSNEKSLYKTFNVFLPFNTQYVLQKIVSILHKITKTYSKQVLIVMLTFALLLKQKVNRTILCYYDKRFNFIVLRCIVNFIYGKK